MATSHMSEFLQRLRSAVLPRGAGRTDAQLLDGFLGQRDEAALAGLVQRHAPMVWGVCRRILRNDHDAEDAFQATFLVLVRRAAAITSRELLANWLYGVACQTARKARASAAQRRTREKQVPVMPEPETAPQHRRHDLQGLLDQELNRLPVKYRLPLVLCDIEGKSRREAAEELCWPEGTVAGRLARARQLLAKLLARHGLVLSAASLAAVLSQAAAACPPAALLASTVQAASQFAAGPAAPGMLSPAFALAEGVLKTMLQIKQRTATAALVMALALGVALGTGGLHYLAPGAETIPEGTEAKGAEKVAEGQKGNTDRPAEKPEPKSEAGPQPKPDGNGLVATGMEKESLEPPAHLSPAQKLAWEKVVAQKVEMRAAKGGGIHAYFLCLSPCDDAGLARLATIPGIVEVSVNMSEAITNKGMVHFANMPALRNLILHEVYGVGGKGLAELKRCQSLEELHLALPGELTDQGLSYLADVPKLKVLSIGYKTKLTEKSLEHFKRMKSLTHLSFHYIGFVEPALLDRLRQELPRIKVEVKIQL
jgi:RNA polymerase sigma factor (sigma-70 family)